MHGFQRSHLASLLTVEPFCPFDLYYKDTKPYGVRIEDPKDVSWDGDILVVRGEGCFTMLNLAMVREILVDGVEYDRYLEARARADARDLEAFRKYREKHTPTS